MVINNPRPTSFAMSLGCDAELSNATRAFDKVAERRVKGQAFLDDHECTVIQQLFRTPGEYWGFYKNQEGKCTPLAYQSQLSIHYSAASISGDSMIARKLKCDVGPALAGKLLIWQADGRMCRPLRK